MATLSKNIFWSTFTSALQLYTGSAVFIVLAKLLSVNDFGILSFGFSLSALALIVSDFGFSLMVIKDYPQQQKGHGNYLFNSVLAKMIMSIASGAIFLGYLFLFYQGEWLKVGALYILFATAASFVIYLQALLRVQNRFQKYAESNIVYAIAITISVLVFWQFQITFLQLVGCLLLAKIMQLLWTVFLCRASFPQFSLQVPLITKLLQKSWSFGVFSILGIFYFMVDTQIISIYLGAEEVALYQAVFRIILILMMFSDVISNVLLPYLSFKFHNNENISELVSKIFLYLLLIGCSLFLGFTSFKSELLTLLYTEEYLEATALVLPFSIVLILRVVSSLLGNILTISDKQIYRVVTVSISLIVSLVLNLILIPKYGIPAAAWTSVIVHIILFGMYAAYSKKENPTLRLFSPMIFLMLVVTALIYTIIHLWSEGNLWIILSCALIWIAVVFGIMKRDNNFEFLKQVMREKGVG